MAEEKRKILTGFCPTCASKLEYYEGDTRVTCNKCDNTFKVDDIRPAGGTARPVTNQSYNGGSSYGDGLAVSSGGMPFVSQGIDTPESALVYVKNYFKTFNWTHYKLDGDLYLAPIMAVVEEKKIKSGSSPIVWLLDFESKVIPLNHKLDSLKELEERMYRVYDSRDYTRSLEVFDTYSFIMQVLLIKKDSIFTDLQSDLDNAKQFKLEATNYKHMEEDFKKLKARFDEIVHAVKELKDEKIIVKAQKDLDEKFRKEYMAKTGEDAAAVYNRAVEAYEDKDFSRAAFLFSSIRGYSDSTWYLDKVNKPFLFHKSIIRIGEKNYYIRPSKPSDFNTFNVRRPEENENVQPGQDPNQNQTYNRGYSLFAIDDNYHIEDHPLIAGISQVITVFAGKLIFIHKNEDICYFSSNNNSYTTLIDGKRGDFSVHLSGKTFKANAFYFNKDHTGVFFRQKLVVKKKEEKEGCFASLFGKKDKNKKEVTNNNNFSLMFLDLVNLNITKIIPEMIDILEYKDADAAKGSNRISSVVAEYGDIIFYYAEKPEDRKEDGTSDPRMYIYNLKERKDIGVLDHDCEVNDVIDDYIIYSQWTPNDYNKNLFVYNLNTNEFKLIEKNILDFVYANEYRIFYTVGNDVVNPLFSNSYDGNSRAEIMKHVKDFVAFQSGWMYVIKGDGLNAALVKISEDGAETIIVCTQFETDIKVTPSHVYYIDTRGRLCCVRANGTNDKVISESVGYNDVVVDTDQIFIFRSELVDDNTVSKSLYVTDIDGNDMRKIEFNVTDAKNFDETYIYVRKDENLLFEYKDMSDDRVEKTSTVSHHRISYLLFNKKTFEFSPIAISKDPSADEKTIKRGCFRKKIKYQPTYTLLPNKVRIRRKNLAAAGAVSKQQAMEAAAANARANSNNRGSNAVPFVPLLIVSIILTITSISLGASLYAWLGFIFSVALFIPGVIISLVARRRSARRGAFALLIGFVVSFIANLIILFVQNHLVGGIVIFVFGLLAAVALLLGLIIGIRKEAINSTGPKVVLAGLSGAALIVAIVFLIVGLVTGIAPGGKQGGKSIATAVSLNSGSNTIEVSSSKTYFSYAPGSNGICKFEFGSSTYNVEYEVTDAKGDVLPNVNNTRSTSSSTYSVQLKSNERAYIGIRSYATRESFAYEIKINFSSTTYTGVVGATSRVSSAPMLSTGTNTLALNNQTHYYRFQASGSSGGSVTYACSNSLNYSMYDESGNYISGSSSSQTQGTTFTLPRAGTYYVGISYSGSSSLRDYSVTVSYSSISGIVGGDTRSTSNPTLTVGTKSLALKSQMSYYKFIANYSGYLSIIDSSHNTYFSLYTSQGSTVSPESGTSSSERIYNISLNGTYYIGAQLNYSTSGYVTIETQIGFSQAIQGSSTMSSSAPALSNGINLLLLNNSTGYFRYDAQNSGKLSLACENSSSITYTFYDYYGSQLSSSGNSCQLSYSGTYYVGIRYGSSSSYSLFAHTVSLTNPIMGSSSMDSSAPTLYAGETKLISSNGSNLYFRFYASSQTYTIYSQGGYDTVIYIYSSSGSQVAYDDDSGDGHNFRVSFSPSSSGYYYLCPRLLSNSSTWYDFNVVIQAN